MAMSDPNMASARSMTSSGDAPSSSRASAS
uniref:Aprl1 n=1 Tax=Arundo donax TaxID=35708 RepID=A0A0A9F4Q3_ARUDO